MPSNKPVRRNSNLTESAYRYLEEQIVEMHIAPGERLSEAETARVLRMSRGPVREAMRKLESSGLIVREVNRGVRVAEFDETELQELDTLRCHLLALAGRLAAKNASPDQNRNMRTILKKMNRAVVAEDYSGYSALNIQFHNLLNEMSGNAILSEHLGQVLKKIRRYNLLAMSFREGMLDSFESHKRILSSIESRDSNAAEKELSDHGRLSYQVLLSNFDRLRRAFRSDGNFTGPNGHTTGNRPDYRQAHALEAK